MHSHWLLPQAEKLVNYWYYFSGAVNRVFHSSSNTPQQHTILGLPELKLEGLNHSNLLTVI